MDYTSEDELRGWDLINAHYLQDVINRLIRQLDDLEKDNERLRRDVRELEWKV